MNKKEILIKLNELDLNKKDYIIIGEAALVLHNIKRSTNDIYLSSDLPQANKTSGKFNHIYKDFI